MGGPAVIATEFQNAREWRNKHGLTQREAGAIFGWSQPGWYHRENESEMTAEFGYALAYLDEHPELIRDARIKFARSRAAAIEKKQSRPKGLRSSERAVWELADAREGRRIKLAGIPEKISSGAYELVRKGHAAIVTRDEVLWLDLI
jgi:hypothetical protein